MPKFCRLLLIPRIVNKMKLCFFKSAFGNDSIQFQAISTEAFSSMHKFSKTKKVLNFNL